MAKGKIGGLINRMIMGSEKSEGYARSTLPSNRWGLFWDILKGSWTRLLGVNLLILLFFIPLVLVLVYNQAYASYVGGNTPFSQNIGIGYPVIPDMTGVTEQVNVMVTTSTYLFVPLAAVIAAIGVAGGAYVIRNMVWTEGIFVANDFWRGIKQNFGVIVGALLLYSIFFVLSKISLAYTDLMLALGQSQAWLLWIAKGATYIVLALATVMVFWMISMGVTYQLSFWKLIKNAFLMTISLIPTNIFFLFLSLISVILTFLGGIFTTIGILLPFTFGFSVGLLVWTDYSHWVFDKFINDRVPGAQKNRGIYEKVNKDDAESIKRYKEQMQQFGRSALTTRPIKPITDDELKLVELPATFNREDLKKLQESKEAIYKDAEEYVEAHKDDEQYQLTEEEKKLEDEREKRKEEARKLLEKKEKKSRRKKESK